MNEIELAWALATVADPHLGVAERHAIYIAIAVGDTFAAIRSLTATLVRVDSGLSAEMKATIERWLDSYRGSDDEPGVRELLARVTTHPTYDQALPGHGPAVDAADF
ncbi:MAG: hypothetical protein JWR32_91 [Mycobacterium sp.]|jgi:hypothetical protein|nr:hypothetical protein [Mycobacterium sp.]